MSPETVLALNEINRRFYRTSAEAFSASRDYPWLGWERIVGGFPEPPHSVLDVGCGNGRFGVYLAASLGGGYVQIGEMAVLSVFILIGMGFVALFYRNIGRETNR